VLGAALALVAQESPRVGALPSANFNWQVRKDWSVNAKIESRHSQNQPGLTDLSWIAAKNTGLNARLAGGYLIRFEEGERVHRFIQQYAFVQRLRGFRLAHRWVSDQSLSTIEKPRIRFRYRLATELPLNGKSVDPGEFYLKLNHEYLNSLQARAYDLEIRWVPVLGYALAENLKIESGLDYRIDSFLKGSAEQVYWLTFNVFLDL
jgi:hypothetical protein